MLSKWVRSAVAALAEKLKDDSVHRMTTSMMALLPLVIIVVSFEIEQRSFSRSLCNFFIKRVIR